LEFTDKSTAWLSVHLPGILISENPRSVWFYDDPRPEVKSMIWFFDRLIEKKIILYSLAVQKMKRLLQINRRIPRDESEKMIKEWEKAASGQVMPVSHQQESAGQTAPGPDHDM
jgi:hypothetical protein